jgi:tRNA(Ile2) C34 agmatinyltransferase TiaS
MVVDPTVERIREYREDRGVTYARAAFGWWYVVTPAGFEYTYRKRFDAAVQYVAREIGWSIERHARGFLPWEVR